MAEKTGRLLGLLAVLCLLLPCFAGAEDPAPITEAVSGAEEQAESRLPEEYREYELCAENDKYEMYLYEPQISILLRNKENGSLISSTLNEHTAQGRLNKTWKGYTYSGFVMDVLTGSSKNYKQADLLNNEHTLEYTRTGNGFDAAVFFPEYGLGLTMQVRLEDDELLVTIPDSSIREETEGICIATVSVYPMFGATFMEQREGYMLIPDGNGALIHLTDKEERFATGYSQLIYGSDSGFTESSPADYLWDTYETVVRPRQVMAPVFGMAHTDEKTGYIAVVEKGENRCSIEAHPNGVMRVSYNRCFAKFLLRDVYKQPLNQSESTKMDMLEKDRTHHDLAVRYCLLTGDRANYMGMAARYRKYLTDEGVIQPRDDSYRTRIDFLAEDQEKFLVGTRAVVMTSVADVEEIYGELQEAGVSSVISSYRGWQAGGIWKLPVNAFNADGAIGGTGALKELILKEKEKDYLLIPYVDALRMNASTNTFTHDAAKMVNKTTLKEKNSKQVYQLFYYLLPEKTAERLAELKRSMNSAGIPFLAVGGITDTLFSYSLKDRYYTRNDGAEQYSKALEDLSGSMELALEEPFQYQWKYTGSILDMPLDGSDYMYTDEEVPFLTLALKGLIPMYSKYVNFEANKREFFLNLAETGVYPSFYLTKQNSSDLLYTNSNDLYSTQYSAYMDTIVEYDRELRALADKTHGAVIVNHEKLEGDVRRVTYSNGTVVYINYSDGERSVDGLKLAPVSFLAGGEAQ